MFEKEGEGKGVKIEKFLLGSDRVAEFVLEGLASQKNAQWEDEDRQILRYLVEVPIEIAVGVTPPKIVGTEFVFLISRENRTIFVELDEFRIEKDWKMPIDAINDAYINAIMQIASAINQEKLKYAYHPNAIRAKRVLKKLTVKFFKAVLKASQKIGQGLVKIADGLAKASENLSRERFSDDVYVEERKTARKRRRKRKKRREEEFDIYKILWNDEGIYFYEPPDFSDWLDHERKRYY